MKYLIKHIIIKHINSLKQYNISFYKYPYCDIMKFIETKVSAINCKLITFSHDK